MNESFDPRPQYQPLPPHPDIAPPSQAQQSWGAVIAVVLILLMIVVGAFYAWGKRIAQERGADKTASTTSVVNE